ncbi:sulfite exporter TauE/SafE family protein [Roseivirga sp. BDSF3-8]|uniref:sulfite exporter TauE/SafE family protein n=1 Tax=Roseivirga sp. BDSF3-8 TaxID=3241598 RepID=UPI00353186ED
MTLVPAFIIGFAGSLHCVGMCGPLALAVPAGSIRTGRWLLHRTAYQAGRLLVYALLGALIALAGQGAAFAGWQKALSIGAGMFLLLLAVLPAQMERLASGNGRVAALISRLRKKLSVLIKAGGWKASATLGALNGLLPCGLVYAGLAGALLTGSALNGALWMLAFGLGTLPAMILVLTSGNLLLARFRPQVRKVMPLTAGLLGVVLIIRGLELGVPYLSPLLEWTTRSIPVCGG